MSWRRAGGVFVLALMMLAPARSAVPARAQLPNLVPLAPFAVRLGEPDPGTGSVALRFSVAVANRSDYAFDLLGTPTASTSRSDAHQCVAWAAPRACTERAPIGSFVWHPEHQHHHFEDFAEYELRSLTATGRPDMSPKGLVAGGQKISFCLIDYEPDERDRDPAYDQGWPLYLSCAAGAGQQGISPGWRDVYSWYLEGQQIVVDDVAPGTYALVVHMDPDRRILESNDADNTTATRLRLLPGDGLKVECAYDEALRACTRSARGSRTD